MMSNICTFYQVNASTYGKYYRQRQSDFKTWSQLKHCEDYLLFEQNIGSYLSLGEVSVSKGELYAFVTNKAVKETIVVWIAGNKT